ncbi:hypothetical protein AB3R30_24785 [Leptolyngbyaceae cyanobacterium UHCC 1019]
MNTTTQQNIKKVKSQSNSVEELTKALEEIIQKLGLEVPQNISILFDGVEVYRYQIEDRNVYWWGLESKEIS